MKKKVIQLKYLSHFNFFTGKYDETVATYADSLKELISEIEPRYPGFKDIVIDRNSGDLDPKIRVIIWKEGSLATDANAIGKSDCKLEHGMVVSFY